MRRWLVILLLGLAGCRGGSGDVSTTTTTTLAPFPVETTQATLPTTSSTVSAAFAVPAVIDVPYVQRVLEAIYHLDGEATRHVYATKVPDTELDERLEAIFGNPVLTNAKKLLKSDAEGGFRLYADPPGDARVQVLEILQSTATCIVVRANLDYGPQFREYRPPGPQSVVQMSRADVLPYNPTGWGVVAAGPPKPGGNLEVCS